MKKTIGILLLAAFVALSFTACSGGGGGGSSWNNLIEYKEGVSLITSTDNWTEKVNLGRGWSYGVEFLVQRTVGKFTGLIGYTWSRTERKFDREGMLINGGKKFPARYDRTHDLSVTLQYRPIKLIDLPSCRG